MDSLLGTLVILLIMAVSSWLQRKAGQQQQRPKPPARPPMHPPAMPPQPRGAALPTQPPPRPVRKIDWQEELRRLLEGDAEPAEPPPVIVREVEPAPPPSVIVPKPAPRPVVVAADLEEGPQSSRLTASIAAYKKAQQLHEEAAARLQQTVEQTKARKLGERTARSGKSAQEIASAISLIRNPASVRQAFVTSVVLSPPKALEN
ncbi:MAG: hypothetical protein HYY23_00450 [Verrucomicrobia bacterium]|nr:hypothetical protein [Verrucomicrobiota bacterium]